MFRLMREVWEMSDLRKRVLFTLLMIALYRLGVFVPVPGIDRTALAEWLTRQSGSLFSMYDMFSGGALSQYSIFFLGIMPYITASIVMQLLSEMVPALKRVKEEGTVGAARINQYARYLTIVIACIQSYAIALGTESATGAVGDLPVVLHGGYGFRAMTMLTMTAGAGFVMWLGEQISERGVGNGSSILISSGIVAGMPVGALGLVNKVQNGEMKLLGLALLVVFMFVVVFGIVFVERGQRRVPLRHAKRVVQNQVFEGQSTYLPLKVNVAGVVPPIFASSLLVFPMTLAQFFEGGGVRLFANLVQQGSWLYNFLYVVCIVFFAFFYTAISFNPEDVADNLKKQGAFISRVRPGRETSAYLDWLLIRLTAGGSVYLAVICVLPSILISSYGVPFYFGGTSLLILVGVSLDTVGQVRAALSTKYYAHAAEGSGGGRVRNRRRGSEVSSWVN